MSFLMRQVAHCDVCGHEWLTAGTLVTKSGVPVKVPSHCAKCKSRKWNQSDKRFKQPKSAGYQRSTRSKVIGGANGY